MPPAPKMDSSVRCRAFAAAPNFDRQKAPQRKHKLRDHDGSLQGASCGKVTGDFLPAGVRENPLWEGSWYGGAGGGCGQPVGETEMGGVTSSRASLSDGVPQRSRLSSPRKSSRPRAVAELLPHCERVREEQVTLEGGRKGTRRRGEKGNDAAAGEGEPGDFDFLTWMGCWWMCGKPTGRSGLQTMQRPDGEKRDLGAAEFLRVEAKAGEQR